MLIAGTLDWLSAAPEPAAEAPPAPPRLLNRLDPGKRGALISLSVRDHYVEVTTTRGRDLLLLRLTDAIADTDPEPGLRIHRSHWVATAHVARVRRDGDRGVLDPARRARVAGQPRTPARAARRRAHALSGFDSPRAPA